MSDQPRSTGVRTGWTPAGRLLPASLARSLRTFFVVAGLLAAVALCGCQMTAPSTRQTRADSIPPAKTDDATPVAAKESGAAAETGSVDASATKAGDAAGTANAGPAPAAKASSAPSAGAGLSWANIFGRNPSPDRLVLPRNDQEAENGSGDAAADKTAANEF